VGRFVLSPEALDDLDTIWEYIARENAEAADRVIESAYRVCKNLADHSELGPRRAFPDNDPSDIRFFVITDFPNYLIFYRNGDDAVEIVRVLHGSQDIDDLFSG
jgi:plasmid stabilization system protein ParE